MKVAHLTTVDLSLRYLVFSQMLAVRDAGGEAIGISAPGPWVDELEAAGIRHIPLHSSTRGMDIPADLRAARQLWKILRRENLDVLHTHNPKPGLYGRVLGRLAGVPIVVNTVHDLYATPDDPLPKRALFYALEAFASRFSDAELVQNPEFRAADPPAHHPTGPHNAARQRRRSPTIPTRRIRRSSQDRGPPRAGSDRRPDRGGDRRSAGCNRSFFNARARTQDTSLIPKDSPTRRHRRL